MTTLFYDGFSGSGSLVDRISDSGLWWKNQYVSDPTSAGVISGGLLRLVDPRSNVVGDTQDSFVTDDGYTVTAGVYITPPIGPDPAPNPEEDPAEGGSATLVLTLGRRFTDEWVTASLHIQQYSDSFAYVYAPGLQPVYIPIAAVGVGYHTLRVTVRNDGSFVTYVDGYAVHDSPGRGVGVLSYTKMGFSMLEGRYGLSLALDYVHLTDDGQADDGQAVVQSWWRNAKNATLEPL